MQVHHDIRSSSPAPGTPDEKRRSTRNTQKKVYRDDLDLNLSDDDEKEEHPEGIAEIRSVGFHISIRSTIFNIFFDILKESIILTCNYHT